MTDRSGTAVPGHVLGFDWELGFGLVQALQPAPAVQLYVCAECDVGEPVVIVSAPIEADREAT